MFCTGEPKYIIFKGTLKYERQQSSCSHDVKVMHQFDQSLVALQKKLLKEYVSNIYVPTGGAAN